MTPEARQWMRRNRARAIPRPGLLDSKRVNYVIRQIEKYPWPVRRILRNEGIRFEFVAGTSIVDHPSYVKLKAARPRGWESGSWEDAAGIYDWGMKRIVLAVNGIQRRGYFLNLVLHETAHAIDHALDSRRLDWCISMRPAWKTVWLRCRKTILRHWRPAYNARYFAYNADEFFCEVASHLYYDKNTRAAIRRVVPTAAAFVSGVFEALI